MVTLILADGPARAGELIIPAAALLVVALVYVAPTLVAVIRRVPETGTLAAINLFLGWTVIGWVATMIMATGAIDRTRNYRARAARAVRPSAEHHSGRLTPSDARRYGRGDPVEDHPSGAGGR